MELLVIAILLTVAEAQLVCKTNCTANVTAEGDPITYGCLMAYSGGTRPVLTWYNKQDEEKELRGIPFQVQDGSIIYVGQGVIEEAVAPDLTQLICVAGDRSAPDFQCESPSCNILYSVRNVVTSPELYASPGEMITCIADGNPPPKFEWQQKKDSGDGKWKTVANETSETIEAFLSEGTSIQLRCVAKNTVRKVEHPKESAEVTVSKYGAYIRTAIIVGVCVGVVLLGGTAGVIYKVKN